MKQIVLCDAGNYERVSKLCKKFNLGVNINISTPENNSKEINEITKCYKGVEILFCLTVMIQEVIHL